MKKTNIKIASIFLLLILICTVTGCSSNTDALSEPQYAPPLFYQIKTDKAQYSYGEEVTIEFLFGKNINYNTKENSTYCVKIKESPYYEIIGDGEVCVNTSEINEKYSGEYADYWYRAVFKIKIKSDCKGTYAPEILVKCVDDEYIFESMSEGDIHYSGDSEYPFRIPEAKFNFTADEEGVEFCQLYSNVKAPKVYWYTDILRFIGDLIRPIYMLIYNFISNIK